MAGYEAELTTALRERGELREGEAVLAAWSGKLIELRGDDPAPDLPAVAIFGITRQTGHILSRLGSYSFALSHVSSPFSPYLGQLRFDVDQQNGPPTHVTLAVDGALAIAEQLREAGKQRDLVGARRPMAKRRTEDQTSNL